jgi:uncharacterized protein DUF2637
LVRTRAGGLTYWCALVMTFALAACAFVLSFDALRSLAVTLGLHESIAWLWPCAIDVAIAQATVCLLSLSRRAAVVAASDAAADAVSLTEALTEGTAVDLVGATPVRGYAMTSRDDGPSSEVPAKAGAESGEDPMPSLTTADIERWRPVAESIVLEGVTSKPARLVATVLALREAGASASNIGRHHNVHATTVGKIESAAEALTA